VNTTVTIHEVLYTNTRGFTVFRASDGNGTSRYVAQGVLFRAPLAGECWLLEWHMEEDPTFGSQRRVSQASLIQPRGEFLIDLLSRHPALRGLGLGVVTATRLYRSHGPELAHILTRGELDRLIELPEDIAFELCERWRAPQLEPNVVAWLDARGFTPRIASKIVALYGDQSIEALETNPYCLLPFVPFQKIDALARGRLGIAEADERRLVAAVEAALYRALNDGHTATRQAKLENGLLFTCGTLAGKAIDTALDQHVVFARGNHIQAYAPALMERTLEGWVKDICNPAGPHQQSLPLASLSSVDTILGREVLEEHIQITDEQRRAVKAAFAGRLHCIIGGAGVGKSTVLRLLGRLITATQGQVFYMAISGRASRRIQEVLGPELNERCSVSTVARYLLSLAPKLPAEAAPWLVVDEASMLDLRSAYRLVTESPPAARLVLVGDDNPQEGVNRL
jgi:exodeoxyribonuclease V alpha subunit